MSSGSKKYSVFFKVDNYLPNIEVPERAGPVIQKILLITDLE